MFTPFLHSPTPQPPEEDRTLPGWGWGGGLVLEPGERPECAREHREVSRGKRRSRRADCELTLRISFEGPWPGSPVGQSVFPTHQG